MQLTVAERPDFIQIAKQVYDLWSAGLAKDVYRQLLSSNYYQSWSRRHNYRLVYKHNEEVIVSCKVVHLSLLMKGKYYPILGLGAIYTSAKYRGQGLATELVKSVIELAEQDNFDGILLFSDIDRQFYASCGFANLGNLDFQIDPFMYSIEESTEFTEKFKKSVREQFYIEHKDAGVLPKLNILFRFSSFAPWIENNEWADLVACHNRWLARQPYGIFRPQNYFAFQLARYLFISTYSRSRKPRLCLTTIKRDRQIAAYAFSEYSETNLRILEIIGNQSGRALLWQALIRQAKAMNLQQISGFESGVCDFIPNNRLDTNLLKLQPELRAGDIRCARRFWGQPMFLALNDQLDTLGDYNPCPLLELDYF